MRTPAANIHALRQLEHRVMLRGVEQNARTGNLDKQNKHQEKTIYFILSMVEMGQANRVNSPKANMARFW